MWKDNTDFVIEGWIPSPVEQSLIDGTFVPDDSGEPVPEDMLEFYELHEAIDMIFKELEDPSLIGEDDCPDDTMMGELPYISDEELEEIFLPTEELAEIALRDFDEQLARDEEEDDRW